MERKSFLEFPEMILEIGKDMGGFVVEKRDKLLYLKGTNIGVNSAPDDRLLDEIQHPALYDLIIPVTVFVDEDDGYSMLLAPYGFVISDDVRGIDVRITGDLETVIVNRNRPSAKITTTPGSETAKDVMKRYGVEPRGIIGKYIVGETSKEDVRNFLEEFNEQFVRYEPNKLTKFGILTGENAEKLVENVKKIRETMPDVNVVVNNASDMKFIFIEGIAFITFGWGYYNFSVRYVPCENVLKVLEILRGMIADVGAPKEPADIIYENLLPLSKRVIERTRNRPEYLGGFSLSDVVVIKDSKGFHIGVHLENGMPVLPDLDKGYSSAESMLLFSVEEGRFSGGYGLTLADPLTGKIVRANLFQVKETLSGGVKVEESNGKFDDIDADIVSTAINSLERLSGKSLRKAKRKISKVMMRYVG